MLTCHVVNHIPNKKLLRGLCKMDSRREIRNMSRDRLNTTKHNCNRIAKPEGFVPETQATSQTI